MSLRHAILGLLAGQPMSGYELKRAIDESVGHFWTADQSQIYRTLSGLVDDGLAARRTVVQEDRPNLHLHSVTASGLAELDRWLASGLQATPTREPFLARLFFAERLPLDEVRKLLDARRQETSELLTALEAVAMPEPSGSLGHALRSATLANGITHARAELEWLDAVERQLDQVGQ
ncbi:PadR family transcriptional regulator [Actinomadura rudentiformis]|uniref:PadR family transcriptional regulator n=1 Tax=Actinomadura rudentiformis TaxID=359158 RepID=A0A6H9YUR1_9ACTN|nr:PadR family transcriptional regulator [Actinomadura rudentiformis]KAB2352347.1 PadR family transcriptional regulator [Actinomadura rudentiformis]